MDNYDDNHCPIIKAPIHPFKNTIQSVLLVALRTTGAFQAVFKKNQSWSYYTLVCSLDSIVSMVKECILLYLVSDVGTEPLKQSRSRNSLMIGRHINTKLYALLLTPYFQVMAWATESTWPIILPVVPMGCFFVSGVVDY